MYKLPGLRLTTQGLNWRPYTPVMSNLRLLFSTKTTSKQTKPTTKPKEMKINPFAGKREEIWTFPNILTMTRLAAAPCIGYFVVKQAYPEALGLMAYACITDFVDGYLARKHNTQTIFGSIADPAADKALMVTLASCLTYAGAVPWWCGVTILGRDILLALSALVVRYKTLPEPKTFGRFWDLGIPSVKVEPTTISKWNTFFQMVYLGCALASPVFPILPEYIHTGMATFVTGTTLMSGLSYVFSKTAVKRL